MTVIHSAAASYVPSGAEKRNFASDGEILPSPMHEQGGLIVPFYRWIRATWEDRWPCPNLVSGEEIYFTSSDDQPIIVSLSFSFPLSSSFVLQRVPLLFLSVYLS